jgi:hypothetical protein
MYKQDTENMFYFYVYTVIVSASGQALSVFKVLYASRRSTTRLPYRRWLSYSGRGFVMFIP